MRRPRHCTADGGNAAHALLGMGDIATTRHHGIIVTTRHDSGGHSGGFVAAFADGHVQFCPAGTPVNLTPLELPGYIAAVPN